MSDKAEPLTDEELEEMRNRCRCGCGMSHARPAIIRRAAATIDELRKERDAIQSHHDEALATLAEVAGNVEAMTPVVKAAMRVTGSSVDNMADALKAMHPVVVAFDEAHPELAERIEESK